MSGYTQALQFAADHPALPGHFPGQPLVPGVLLLEQLALALRAWRHQRLVGVPEAKFVAPLRPGEPARLELLPVAASASRARFRIERDGTLLALGVIEGEA
jgi:3-hydroxymyristoyl/3-hydroxydecanoyl-(acyl carrier protein) dehydratase